MAKQTNLFGGWAGKPNSKRRCLEPDESWKAVADMDLPTSLPTSLPTTWLKVVDHPVPGVLCTLCKSTTRYHAVESGWGRWVWSIVSASQKSCGKHWFYRILLQPLNTIYYHINS